MLGNLATKIDFATMNDRIDAQREEIKQIREELTQYKKDFDSMRLAFDRSEAQKQNSVYENADRKDGNRNVNNMATMSRTRRNLVIEGLRGDTEEEMIANLLQITTEIGSIVYKTDVEDIFHMERHDNSNKVPGPVLIMLTRISIRDGILKRKLDLRSTTYQYIAILWDLFDEKIKKHPQLLERHIETAPLCLIKASKSTKWGGGPHFNPNYTIPMNF